MCFSIVRGVCSAPCSTNKGLRPHTLGCFPPIAREQGHWSTWIIYCRCAAFHSWHRPCHRKEVTTKQYKVCLHCFKNNLSRAQGTAVRRNLVKVSTTFCCALTTGNLNMSGVYLSAWSRLAALELDVEGCSVSLHNSSYKPCLTKTLGQ